MHFSTLSVNKVAAKYLFRPSHEFRMHSLISDYPGLLFTLVIVTHDIA